jgi:hypothetical protein
MRRELADALVDLVSDIGLVRDDCICDQGAKTLVAGAR